LANAISVRQPFSIKGGTMKINKDKEKSIFKCGWCEIKMHKSYESPRISKGERVCKDCNNTFLVLDVS
jgi:hypothetical protein